MKKVVILLAVASLLAAPAFAGIRYSKHDLSSTSGRSYASINTNELCVFCHTPHGGATGGFAPLWNRSLGSHVFGVGDLYNSSTLESASKPNKVVTAVNESDAKLCLSCHDGGSLAVGLLNPPASNGNVDPTFGAKNAITGDADLLETGELVTDGLKNDHPIGMVYDSNLAAADTELTNPADLTKVDAAGLLPLYEATTGNGVMWCSSCHDVHNPVYTPFLNMSNAGSAMCLTCHIK